MILSRLCDTKQNTVQSNTALADTGRVKALEKEVMDLKVTNRGKDYFIEQLQKEREGLLDQVVSTSRKVGELET